MASAQDLALPPEVHAPPWSCVGNKNKIKNKEHWSVVHPKPQKQRTNTHQGTKIHTTVPLVPWCLGALVPWCLGALVHWCLPIHTILQMPVLTKSGAIRTNIPMLVSGANAINVKGGFPALRRSRKRLIRKVAACALTIVRVEVGSGGCKSPRAS